MAMEANFLGRRGAILAGAMALALVLIGAREGAGETAAQAQEGPAMAPSPALRLISQSQYTNSIAQIFGPDVVVKIRFAPVPRVDGLLGVGAGTAGMTTGGFDPLEAVGRSVAAQVVAPERRATLFPCEPKRIDAADPECARAFFSEVGRLLYRRPLAKQELDDIVELAGHSVGPQDDFYAGVAYALSGMLVSPEFLFIDETVEPDPARPGAWRLNGYAKASRLSFLLWNTSPDDALLTAAGRGELNDPAGLQRQVDRMIASPLYKDGVRAFFTDFFVMEAFDTLTKDFTVYPAMTLKTIAEAREQVLRTVVDHLVTRERDYRDIYTTRRTFLSSDLGVLYRVPVNLGSQGWVPYEFPAGDARAGILTQIGFLAQHSHATRSSPTRRGRAIREMLLCQHVPDPPPNVDFSNFEGAKAGVRVARDRLSMHNENPVCAGCHSLTDPIGLALENFDGAGQFRTTEVGLPIDPSGELDGVKFSTAAGLGVALRDNPSLKSCIVDRLYAYSVGRKLTPADELTAQRYGATLDKQGYRFDQMLRLIIFDPSFFAVGAPSAGNVALAHAASTGGRHAD
jgi:hypothetical protein